MFHSEHVLNRCSIGVRKLHIMLCRTFVKHIKKHSSPMVFYFENLYQPNTTQVFYMCYYAYQNEHIKSVLDVFCTICCVVDVFPEFGILICYHDIPFLFLQVLITGVRCQEVKFAADHPNLPQISIRTLLWTKHMIHGGLLVLARTHSMDHIQQTSLTLVIQVIVILICLYVCLFWGYPSESKMQDDNILFITQSMRYRSTSWVKKIAWKSMRKGVRKSLL